MLTERPATPLTYRPTRRPSESYRMPRNVLSIPSKTSPLSSSAFSRAIRQHISVNFTDTHPDAFTEDLREIASLRDNVTHMDAHVVHVNAVLKCVLHKDVIECSRLPLRYNAQLVFMGTKFPPDVSLYRHPFYYPEPCSR